MVKNKGKKQSNTPNYKPFSHTAGKPSTPVLMRKSEEEDDTFFKRMAAKGWMGVSPQTGHFSKQSANEFHCGPTDSCPKCASTQSSGGEKKPVSEEHLPAEAVVPSQQTQKEQPVQDNSSPSLKPEVVVDDVKTTASAVVFKPSDATSSKPSATEATNKKLVKLVKEAAAKGVK